MGQGGKDGSIPSRPRIDPQAWSEVARVVRRDNWRGCDIDDTGFGPESHVDTSALERWLRFQVPQHELSRRLTHLYGVFDCPWHQKDSERVRTGGWDKLGVTCGMEARGRMHWAVPSGPLQRPYVPSSPP